jgi:hypothetical protein
MIFCEYFGGVWIVVVYYIVQYSVREPGREPVHEKDIH